MSDDPSLVGEECHIVSSQPGGPRHDSSFPPGEADGYENLLLLCRVHHKMVDDQHETYTAGILGQIKAQHEKWVKTKLEEVTPESKPIRLKRIKQDLPTTLVRITSGNDIFKIIHGSEMFSYDHDELSSQDEVDLVGSFIQDVRDWGELGQDIEPMQQVNAGYELTERLKKLADAGFFVFGGKEFNQLEGGVGPPQPWRTSIIRVVRSSNPSIVSLDAADVNKKP